MPVDMAALAADLAAETAVTRALVAGLDEAGWRTPTPAAGWASPTRSATWPTSTRSRSSRRSTPRSSAPNSPRPWPTAASTPTRIAARYRDRTGAQLLAWFDTARADAARHVRRPGPASPAALVRARP